MPLRSQDLIHWPGLQEKRLSTGTIFAWQDMRDGSEKPSEEGPTKEPLLFEWVRVNSLLKFNRSILMHKLINAIFKSMLIFSVLLLPGLVFGASYTVSQTGSGTDYSVSTFNAINGDESGNTYYFIGTITTKIVPQIYGTSENPVILDGYQAGDMDPINECDDIGNCSGGSGSAALLSSNNAGFWIYNGIDYITVQDFRMTGGGSGPIGDMSLILINSPSLSTKSDHITIQRNYLYNANLNFFTATRSTNRSIGSSYLTVYNNKMVGYGKTGNAPQGLDFYACDNLIVRGNELAGGLDPDASDCTSDQVIAVHTTDNALFEYNDIWGAYQQTGIAIKEPDPWCSNIIVRFNKFHHNGNLTDTIYGEAGGVYVGAWGTNIYVYGNFIYNNGNFGILVHRGMSNVYVWSNLILSNLWYGIVSTTDTVGESWGPNDKIYVYNNTFAYNGSSKSEADKVGLLFTDTAGTDRYVKNNLFYYNRPGQSTHQQVYVSPTGESGVTLDYNTYYYPNETPTVYWESAVRTIPVMFSSYSQEEHGEVADPGFTDPNGSDNTYGTADDNYKLNGSNINDGVDLSGCFSVTVQGQQYIICYDDGLDPEVTDWTTTPPTVGILKRDTYGWSRGAYVYKYTSSRSTLLFDFNSSDCYR